MKFCSSCGSILPESGVCGSCGTSHPPGHYAPPPPSPPSPPPMHHGPPPPPMHHGPPPPPMHHGLPPMHHGPPPMHPGQPPMHHYGRPSFGPNPFEAAIDVLKQFFTGSPERAISTAVGTPTNTWFIYLGVSAIITAVFSVAMIVPIFQALGEFFGYIPTASEVAEILEFMGTSNAQIFIQNLLVAAVVFFVYAGAVKLVFQIYGIEIPFTKVMDLVGAAYIPIILAIAAATLLVFVSIQAAFVVLMLGSVADSVFLYRGMQDYAGERTSVLWGFFAMMGALIILLLVALSIFGPDMYDLMML